MRTIPIAGLGGYAAAIPFALWIGWRAELRRDAAAAMTYRGVCSAPAVVAAMLVIGMTGSRAQQAGDAVRGQAFAQEVCASCHAVRGNASSPNSAGQDFPKSRRCRA